MTPVWLSAAMTHVHDKTNLGPRVQKLPCTMVAWQCLLPFLYDDTEGQASQQFLHPNSFCISQARGWGVSRDSWPAPHCIWASANTKAPYYPVTDVCWWVRATQMKRGVGLFNLSSGHIVVMGDTLKSWRFLHSRILGLNVQFHGGALA